MWHGVVKDVINAVRYAFMYALHINCNITHCDICQRINRQLVSGVAHLHPVPVKAPWHMVGIDFIGPLSPESQDGCKYILTISDYFTKWVEAVPSKDNKAVTVASVLYKLNTIVEPF